MKIEDAFNTKFIFFKAIALDEGGWYVDYSGKNIGSKNGYRAGEGAVAELFIEKFAEVNKEDSNVGELTEEEIKNLVKEEK